MVRVTITASVLILSVVSLALSHQPQVPDSLKGSSGKFGSQQELWTYAIASTCIISAAPFFILFFIPLNNASEHNALLKVLLSFASGGLLGDAFLHLIPHAINPHDHHHDNHSHHHDNRDDDYDDDHSHHHDHHYDHQHNDHHHDDHGHHHDHHHDDHGHHHSDHSDHDHHHDHHHNDHDHNDHDHHHDKHDHHHHNNHDHHHGNHSHDHSQDMITGLWVLAGIFAFLVVEKFVRIVKGGDGHTHVPPRVEKQEKEEKTSSSDKDNKGNLRQRKPNQETTSKQSDSKSHTHHHHHGNSIKVSAYLNLAADFAHNFTDGLAIGASYLAGRSIGIVTTVTILLHEIPHEIGDFAILIQSGFPKRKAMMVQLVTAVGAIAGTVCGLLAEGDASTATSWVLPFTAGGFIYIATVSVIPELLEDSSLWQSIKELAGLCVGIGMMVLIAVYE